MILTRFEEGKIPYQILALTGDRTHDPQSDTKAAFRVRRQTDGATTVCDHGF